jgi:hypothetical protein
VGDTGSGLSGLDGKKCGKWDAAFGSSMCCLWFWFGQLREKDGVTNHWEKEFKLASGYMASF